MRSAVLLSGGLDSAVLLAEEVKRGPVWPVYVRVGLAWESAEQQIVAGLLASAPFGSAGALAVLHVDMTDVYPTAHWAVTGAPPAYHTPDEDVYLPGRNIVLFGKAAVYAALHRLDRIVVGTLDHNPFPDATPAFRSALQAALSLGLDYPLQLDAPYASVGKAEVIRRGVALGIPLERTLSCMKPVAGSPLPVHCGTCSKCRERHDAFIAAGVADPTRYADTTHTGRQ